MQEETARLQAVLAEKENALHEAQLKLDALDSECSALRAAVKEAEAACADLQSRISQAEVRSPPLALVIARILRLASRGGVQDLS